MKISWAQNFWNGEWMPPLLWWFRFRRCLKSIFQWIQCSTLSVEWNENNNIQDGKKIAVSCFLFFLYGISCVRSELFRNILSDIVPSHRHITEHELLFSKTWSDRISTFLSTRREFGKCLCVCLAWSSELIWRHLCSDSIPAAATLLSNSRFGQNVSANESQWNRIQFHSESYYYCVVCQCSAFNIFFTRLELTAQCDAIASFAVCLPKICVMCKNISCSLISVDDFQLNFIHEKIMISATLVSLSCEISAWRLIRHNLLKVSYTPLWWRIAQCCGIQFVSSFISCQNWLLLFGWEKVPNNII